MEAFTEIFPFWTTKQIRRILSKLEKNGYIKTWVYNKIWYDRTKWYTCIWPNGQMELPEQEVGSDQMGEPIPNNNTDENTDWRIVAHRTTTTSFNSTTQENIEQNTFCTSDSFEEFWKQYPKKKWKQKAKRLFISKIKSQKKFEELMQWLSWYIDDHERAEITWEFCPDYQQWDTFMSKETRVDYLDREKPEEDPYELFCKLVYPHWDLAPNVKWEKKYIEKYGLDKLKEMDRVYKDEMFLSLAKW